MRDYTEEERDAVTEAEQSEDYVPHNWFPCNAATAEKCLNCGGRVRSTEEKFEADIEGCYNGPMM